jgi:fibronectin-binding autotransporter adhesin
MRGKNPKRLLVVTILLGTICAFAGPASAAVLTWSGTAGATWDTSSAGWPAATVATPWDSSNGTTTVADFTAGGDTPIVSGGIYANGIQFDNTASITGGTINLAGTTPTVTMNASSGTIGSWLAGAAGLVKAASGTLYLTNGSNNFTGNVKLNAGTLDFSNSSLNTASNTITLGGGTLQWAAGNTQDVSSKLVMLASTTATLDTQGNTVNLGTAFGSATSGALVKLGAGKVTLNGANTYTGGTTVSGGTLGLAAGGSTGCIRGPLTINSGATVATPTGWGLGYSTCVNGITINGGVLAFTDANDQGGTSTTSITMTGGTISVASGAKFDWYNGLTNTPSFITNASSIPSVLGGGINLRLATTNQVTFNVASGTVPSGIDLLVSGAIGTVATNGIIKSNAGLMQLTGANTYTGATTISGGTLMIAGNGYLGTNANYAGAIADNAALVVNSNSNQTFGGVISGTGSLTQIGPGTLTLNQANTYNGGTTIGGGVLAYGAFNALSTSAAVTVNGGVLNMSTFTGGAGAVTLANGGITGSTGVLSATSYDVRNGLISTSLGDVAGSVLTKSTTGTVVLSNANTYTGATSVNAGSLLLNSASLLASGSVSVAAPATFGGSGSAGSATVAAGGTIQGGYSGSGSLALAALTFNGNGGVNLGGLASSYMSSPAIAVAGGLSTNGTNSIAINITGSLAGTPTGTYQLIGYNTIGGSGTDAFVLGTLPNRGSGTLSFPAGLVELTLNGTDYLHWTGAVSNAWDTGTPNWILNSTSGTATYNDTPSPDTVVFDDGAGTNSVVSIASPVHPQSVTFNNSTSSYVLQGVSGIAGATALTINGPGTLTINNSNGYSGGTVLNAGTLIVGNSSALGTGPLTIAATGTTALDASAPGLMLANNTQNWNGNFTFNGSNSLNMGNGAVLLGTSVQVTVANNGLTVGGAIGDGGSNYSLNKTGTGTLVLTGVNTYGGGTTLNAGVLSFANGGLGSAGNITLNGGTLQWAAGNTQDVSASSRLAMVNGATATLDTQGNNVTLGTAIGGNTSAALVKIGSGNLTLNNFETYTGGTTVNGGTLTLGVGNGTGCVRGTLNINQNATVFTTNNGLGYGAGVSVTTVNINGGTLYEGGGFGDAYSGVLNMTAGTLTGPGELDFYGGSGGTPSLTTQASSVTSVISVAAFHLRESNPEVFTVAQGTTPSGIDLLITSPIVQAQFTGNLTKEGAGNMVITGAASYTGSTTINAGTLTVGNAGATGALPAGSAITDNATLVFNRNNAVVQGADFSSAAITGTGGLTQMGVGSLLTLNAANAYSGPTTITAGTISIGGGGSTGSVSSSSAITNNGSLAFNRTDNYGGTFPNAIGGSGSLALSAGTLVLGANNGYTGNTLINGGRLYLGGTNATTNIVVAGGAGLGGGGAAPAATATVGPSGILDFSQNTGSTFSLTGLTFQSNATINMGNVANYTSNPVLHVTGSNALNPSFNPSSIILALSGPAPTGVGTVELMQYSGALGGSGTSAFLLINGMTGGAGRGASFSLSFPSGFVDLLYSTDHPVWRGNLSGDWDTTTANWVLAVAGTATTFLPGDAPVFDDTAGTGQTTIGLNSGDVNPSAVTFSNSGLSYTLTGTNGITGGASLLINGGGAVTIATSNDYAGGTTLTNSLLKLANPAAIGSGLLTLNGGTLDNTSGSAMTLPGNNVQNWNGNVNFLGSGAPSGSLDMGTGAVSMGASTAVTLSGSTLTVGGTLYNAGYALAVNGAGSAVFNGAISGNGALTKNGSGTLVLSASNTYAGGTTLNNGVLVLNNNSALGSASLTINGGTLDSTVAGVTLANNPQNWNGDFCFLGTQSLDMGSAAVALSSSRTVTVDANTVTVRGAISESGTGYALTKAGNGMLSLTAANTYTGGTIVSGGTLYLGNGVIGNGTGRINGALTIDSGAEVNASTTYWSLGYRNNAVKVTNITINNGTLTFRDANALGGIAADNVTMTGGTINGSQFDWYTQLNANPSPSLNTNASSQTAVISSGFNLRLYSNANTLTMDVAQGTAPSGVDLLVSGPITAVSLGSIVKSGAGLLAFTASNTYTGATTINGGTLQLGDGVNDGSINSTSGVTNEAALVYNLAGSQTAGYAIVGSGSLTKTGPGQLTLAGANFYSGGTTVNGGTLQVGAAGAIPSGFGAGDVAVQSPGALDLAGITTNVNGLNGNGTIDTSLSSGTLVVGNNDATSTFSGVLRNSDAGSDALLGLLKTGAGTLTLSGMNTYQGGTSVEGGALVVITPEAIYDGTNLSVGDPMLLSLLPEAIVPNAAAAGSSVVAGLPTEPQSAAMATVPEPGTMALLAAFGLCMTVIYRRFRKY